MEILAHKERKKLPQTTCRRNLEKALNLSEEIEREFVNICIVTPYVLEWKNYPDFQFFGKRLFKMILAD
jgi:hypothetical protein